MNGFLSYFTSFRFLYVVFGGFFFYLLSTIIDPVFIPKLDMAEKWCEKRVERRIRYRKIEECVEFTILKEIQDLSR